MTTTCAPGLLDQAPARFLTRGRGADLERWCLARGFRPTLAHVEAERQRRGITSPRRDTKKDR